MCGCDIDIPTGADGADGADGKTILNGTGVPAPSLGTNGDFYYDTATTDFYGPKTAGVWGSPVTLEGTDGIDGIDGTSAIVFTKEFVGMASGSQTLMTDLELITAGFPQGGHPQEFQVQLWVDSGGLSVEITSHPLFLDFSGADTIFVNIATGALIANFLIPIVAPDVVRLVILG